MNDKHLNKTPALLLGTALTLGLSAGTVSADANPFGLTDLGGGYMVAQAAEGKCGEGKCGSADSAAEKSAEGSCGGDKGAEGSCGGAKSETVAQPKSGEGKCGEGKCGTKG